MPVTVVWGLKRSGIHLVVNWLYANFGGRAKDDIDGSRLHPQLRDGFRDSAAGVAFHNNCGGLNSRRFALGDLARNDFEEAARVQPTTIFGLEDCELRYAPATPSGDGVTNVLLLRDPLNNIASRLEGAKARPEVFRVDEEYVDLMASYCDEFLGHTNRLERRINVDFNRFVTDRAHRDAVADALHVENLDLTSEVSSYGGGSSFVGTGPDASSLMARHEQHPVPARILDLLVARPAVVEACDVVFGFDLAQRGGRR